LAADSTDGVHPKFSHHCNSNMCMITISLFILIVKEKVSHPKQCSLALQKTMDLPLPFFATSGGGWSIIIGCLHLLVFWYLPYLIVESTMNWKYFIFSDFFSSKDNWGTWFRTAGNQTAIFGDVKIVSVSYLFASY